jgi:uncharacterized protein YeeX (DUF496 family)
MNDKKKGKGNPNRPSRKKNISTFSKYIENENKRFKDLFVPSPIPDSVLQEIQLYEKEARPHLALLGLISETELETYRRQAEEFLSLGIDEITRIRESISDQHLKELENSISLIDSYVMLESSLSIDMEELKQIEDSYINLPIRDLGKSLSEISTFDLHVNEFKPIKSIDNEYLLRTTIIESIDFGNIKFNTVQQTQLQVQSLKGDVKEIKKTFIKDARKKDEMLEELLDYFRNGGTSIVKIKKIKYNKKSAELIIDDKIVKIKADTNQHYLCKILFSSKKSIQRVWEIYDIVEALGENANCLEGWVRIIYDTVRRLNEKIQLQTGIERFILYDSKTVIVNPKYLDST